MASSTGLVISTRPRNQLLMVLDAWPFERMLPHKPGWMGTDDWVNLLVWLILVTQRDEPPTQAWYRLIDRAFDATRESLRKKRVINVDEVTVATDALYDIGQTYQHLCPLLYGVLTTIYPQIEEGYRIRFLRLDITGLYLLLTLE